MKSQDEQWLLNEKHNGQKTKGFLADCERLASGEPLGYVIGWVPFLDCKIYLDSRPLIPRSETEFWVEKAIEEIKRAAPKAPRVLDLCAGSGAIGVALARAVPEARVTFGELQTQHLSTIERNLDENIPIDWKSIGQCGVVHTNLFENVAGPFDYILCNPPYIDPALDRTESSVKDHEPYTALYGGVNGLELIARIITEAPVHLTEHGVLYLEHEPEQACAIHCLGARSGFTVQTFTDQYGLARYTRLQKIA